MPIQIDMLTLGLVQTNCYLISQPETGEGLVIDPADNADAILRQAEERGVTIGLILATHTHFDHILASYALKEATGAPFWLHEEGVPQLQQMVARARFFGLDLRDPAAEPDDFITHGQVIEAVGLRLEARYTPGHSPGHLIFVSHEEQIAFVGDCIFRDGIGRADLPDSDTLTLKNSIVEQILPLPDEMRLLSGHGPVTTLGRERINNFSLSQLLQIQG